MTLPFSRRGRERKAAIDGDFPETGESITEILERVRLSDTEVLSHVHHDDTIAFDGASAGTMPQAEVYGDAARAAREAGLRQAVTLAAPPAEPDRDAGPKQPIRMTSPDTQPLGMLRAQPPYPAAPPPGYTAGATGPQPVIGRERPAIGDALALDEQWGPALTNLPCGHCGATLDADPAVAFERTRTIGYLNWLARQAGWVYDTDLIWTCPPCQAAATWKARQGQLEVHRYGVTCQRNHLAAEPHGDCTCPGAVLAVDAMLASRDYLGSAR